MLWKTGSLGTTFRQLLQPARHTSSRKIMISRKNPRFFHQQKKTSIAFRYLWAFPGGLIFAWRSPMGLRQDWNGRCNTHQFHSKNVIDDLRNLQGTKIEIISSDETVPWDRWKGRTFMAFWEMLFIFKIIETNERQDEKTSFVLLLSVSLQTFKKLGEKMQSTQPLLNGPLSWDQKLGQGRSSSKVMAHLALATYLVKGF